MAPTATTTSDEIAFEFMPFFRGYKDGRVERHLLTDFVPTSLDPNNQTGVVSKDVVIVPETGVSARLFLPTTIKPDQKLPLLIYFHGGAFCFGSPFCAMYHTYLTSLVAKANVVALSVDYRLAPEHPLPAAYEDAWDTLKWVASHSAGHGGAESWLNDYADFRRVFLAGDSAGSNISHNTAMRAGAEELAGLKLFGLCVIHPDFVGKEGSLNKAWPFTCPNTSGENDPRINPAIDPKLSSLGCSKLLVCVAEKDAFRDAGWIYFEAIKKKWWQGEVEIVETLGEDHVFHLFNPTGEKAVAFLDKISSFINHESFSSPTSWID